MKKYNNLNLKTQGMGEIKDSTQLKRKFLNQKLNLKKEIIQNETKEDKEENIKYKLKENRK